MSFNWKKLLQKSISLNPISIVYLTTLLGLMCITNVAYALIIENPSNICEHTSSKKIPNNINKKVIIVINGQRADSSLINLLKRQGNPLINIITSTKSGLCETKETEANYDNVIIHDKIPEMLQSIKLLLHTKGYSFGDVFAIHQPDVELADVIRETLKEDYKGEAFRNFIRGKTFSINQLNKALQVKAENQVIAIEGFTKAALNHSLPCIVKVINSQQIISTYFIGKSADIPIIFARLKTHKAPNVELQFQPYYENLYRLQISTVNGHSIPVALWHEKSSIKDGEVLNSQCTLVNIHKHPIIPHAKLIQFSQQLANVMGLKQGISEFILVFHADQTIEVTDYSLTLPNPHQMQVMEQVTGYSALSSHLMHAFETAELPSSTKEFKHITAVNLQLNNKSDLLKLSMMPTFYSYYSTNGKLEEAPMVGKVYFVHADKDLVAASCAAIKNMEQLLQNPMFLTHSASHIVNFYREAAANKHADYTLNKDKKLEIAETKKILDDLRHESQHIPRYVKPMDSKANIQDIMKYYIDIYDLYILHGKPPGSKVIPMNTGNPSFLPFAPIIKSLHTSLEETPEFYSKYSMQVPEGDFINKLTQYCHEEQILVSNQKLQPNNVVIGHGSTNLYYLALKSIIKNKGDIVLVTRPTYGLFIDPIYTAGGELGFIDIDEGDDWKVNPQKLHDTLHFYNEKAFNNYILITFIKEYEKFLHALKVFNLEKRSIPPMPSIDGLTDLGIFDSYIVKLNAFIDNIADPLVNKEELKFSFSPRVKAFYHMNPHNPTGAVYSQKDLKELAQIIKSHPGIYVIDDLAHWGVLYEDIEPATFSSIEGMFEKTLTLLSLSKSFCVPSLRTGVAIGDKEIISEMQYRLLNSSSSASLPAMIALDAVISTPKKERDDYLRSNSQEYLFRRDLMDALINGIQQTDLSTEQKIKIHQLILENEYKEGKPFDKKLLNLVLSGIPLVKTLTEPKGCFFHLLDISKLIGARIADNPPFQTATDVRNAIYSLCSINTVPGEISGNFFNYSLRLSFSLPPQQVYEACKNINLFVGNYIIKYNPSILEKNQSSLKSKQGELIEDVTLNRSIIGFYLNKMVDLLTKKYQKTLTSNIDQEETKLQLVLKEKISTLEKFSKQILAHSFDKLLSNRIIEFIDDNEDLLKIYFTDFDQLKKCLHNFKV